MSSGKYLRQNGMTNELAPADVRVTRDMEQQEKDFEIAHSNAYPCFNCLLFACVCVTLEPSEDIEYVEWE